jgi:hypothetical protein
MGASDKSRVPSVSGRFTVLGLFEDTLDMERALIAIRRAGRPAEEISVVLRDQGAEANVKEGGAVSRAVSAHTLDAVGGWLVGLAELVLPDRETFLVAGPLGAAVADAPNRRQAAERNIKSSRSHEHDLSVEGHDLADCLAYFGFSTEESHYLAHRLNAGDAIVGLTTRDANSLRATRRLFADCDAVHIGQAQMAESAYREVRRLLSRPTKAAAGEIVVADAVDPFLNLCTLDRPPKWVKSVCGAQVVDKDGVLVGAIAEILAMPIEEPNDERLLESVRYVVVSFGRVLKLGRRRVAVPKELVDLEQGLPVIRTPASVVHRAPAYNPESPFSRREEESIFAHFGAQPYWKTRRVAKVSTA